MHLEPFYYPFCSPNDHSLQQEEGLITVKYFSSNNKEPLPFNASP
jgi:hypothetical protein